LLTEQYLARDDLPASTRYWRMTIQSVQLGLAAYYREAGRYQKAIEVIEDAKQYSRGYPSRSAYDKASILLHTGRAKEALGIAQYMARHFDDVRAPLLELRIRARATVALGDLDAARAAVEELYADQVNRGAQALAYALKIEAEIALAEEQPAVALEALDKLRQQGIPAGGFFDITCREARARAHRMAGRLDEAVKIHKELLKIYGGHALSHYALGQIYEEMNRPADAEREYTIFLDMWSEADEGLPQLVDARDRLKALRGI
jgi:tetratricopeptide (TPR) repeat protein